MNSSIKNSTEDFVLERYCEDMDGRSCVDDSYREDALKLCRVQGLDLDIREIIFVADNSGGSWREPMAVFPIQPMISDIIFQLTGCRFRFVLKIWQSAMHNLGEAQYSATLLHALRYLRRDPETGAMTLGPGPDVCEWRELLPYVGADGYEGVPNLLETPLVQKNNNEEAISNDTEAQGQRAEDERPVAGDLREPRGCERSDGEHPAARAAVAAGGEAGRDDPERAQAFCRDPRTGLG